MIILVEDVRDDFDEDKHSVQIVSCFDNFKQLRGFLETYQGTGELRWEIWIIGKRQPEQIGDIRRIEQKTYRYEMATPPKNQGGWDRDFDPSFME